MWVHFSVYYYYFCNFKVIREGFLLVCAPPTHTPCNPDGCYELRCTAGRTLAHRAGRPVSKDRASCLCTDYRNTPRGEQGDTVTRGCACFCLVFSLRVLTGSYKSQLCFLGFFLPLALPCFFFLHFSRMLAPTRNFSQTDGVRICSQPSSPHLSPPHPACLPRAAPCKLEPVAAAWSWAR